MSIIRQIGEELGIRPVRHEPEKKYIFRVVLSAISKWMQTAVYTDSPDTSVSFVKRIGYEKISLFYDIAPDALRLNLQDYVDYVYDTLLNNGTFLHRAYHIKPAPHRLIGDSSQAIVRGMTPEENVVFSGLAAYTTHSINASEITNAFNLPDANPEQITQMLFRRCPRIHHAIHIDEYLNIHRSESYQPYYRTVRPQNTKLLYGRTRRDAGTHDYYLIIGNDLRRITDEYVSVFYHEYARLHVMNTANQQVVKATEIDDLVYLSFSFHLPQPDLYILKYIAWPVDPSNLNDRWNFAIQKSLWPLLKQRLAFLEYRVVETHE